MTDIEHELNMAWLNELVDRVQTLRANSMSSLDAYTPNFVMVEPILPNPLMIPLPHEAPKVPLFDRLVKGSVGLAVIGLCLSIAVALSLVHTS